MPDTRPPGLTALARHFGVQTGYVDVAGVRHTASTEVLLQVLRVLGAPLAGSGSISAALRQVRQERLARPLEPVAVAWDGRPTVLPLRVPSVGTERRLTCTLVLESGETREWGCELGALPCGGAPDAATGEQPAVKQLPIAACLPLGYHHLRVEGLGDAAETLVIAAPRRAYAPSSDRRDDRRWGVFLPTYALRSARDWGAGDFTDLEALVRWTASLGGDVVGTLPLLATFLDSPCDPSPYTPASRLFWNELYVDPTRAPEFGRCRAAQDLIRSTGWLAEHEALRAAPLVDYPRLAAHKKAVLVHLAATAFATGPHGRDDLERFRRERPDVEDYARFRATMARHQGVWQTWPERQRDGDVQSGDFDPETWRYHVYVQWLADQQLQHVARTGKTTGAGLYLDLPLGVHADGYDTWREREAFARGAAGGAPPDAFFSRGQNWGFPPLHPVGLREQGYRYFRACLRHHLAYTSALRLDHVMGLHRLFWIPSGADARDGVYVRYPAEELYAVLTLESQRHQALLVGEDLGTVPRIVRSAMARHGVHGMYVAAFEARPEPSRALAPVHRRSAACLDTHDTATFPAFWDAVDVRDRQDLGLLDDRAARREIQARLELRAALSAFLKLANGGVAPTDAASGVRTALTYLAARPARLVLVNLEDLWLETRPQNVPGTTDERPNWRAKARYPLEALDDLPQVVDTLRQVNAARQRGG